MADARTERGGDGARWNAVPRVGMKSFGGIVLLGALLFAVPASPAEKVIVISDSLVANSDKMKAKRGAEWLGHFKWRFGDYAVVASKSGWGSTSTKSNFWKTKTESKSVQKFSFTLANGTTDSAMVDTAHELLAESHQPVKLGHVYVGSSELRESDSFSAFITLTGDTSEAWTLSMGGTSVENPDSGLANRGTYRSVLTRGERTITLAPVTSRKPGGDTEGSFFSRIMPDAMGYEFIENGRSLCAVQYFPGSARVDRYYVWIHKEPDARMRLVLAAAITAVLQKQCSPDLHAPVEESE